MNAYMTANDLSDNYQSAQELQDTIYNYKDIDTKLDNFIFAASAFRNYNLDTIRKNVQDMKDTVY